MPKVLSQSGISLADVYDVEGSIAGIEQLIAKEVNLFHEMGKTIFSERLSATIRRQTSGAINQNNAFDVFFTDLPAGIWRILGLFVFTDVSARLSHAQVSVQNADSSREIPIFVWNNAPDTQASIRFVDDGAAAATVTALMTNTGPLTPSLGVNAPQPQEVGSGIAFRGVATGFGAGTVTATAIVHIAFSEVSRPSSIGLPVPGW